MTAVIWFKQDLRLADNKAVTQAWQNHAHVVAVVTLTERTWQRHHWAPIKRDLYQRRLNALAAELAKLGVALHVLHVAEFTAVPSALYNFMKQQHASDLYFNREYPFDEKVRDRAVVAWLSQHSIQSHVSDDLLLVAPERVQTGQGSFYKKFTPFYKRWLAILAEQGVPMPCQLEAKGAKLPPSPAIRLDGEKRDSSEWAV